MGSKHMVILSCHVLLATLHGIQAVKYNFINNAKTSAGSVRFSNEITIIYTKKQMDNASNSIWCLFQQNTTAQRKSFQDVTLALEYMGGVAHAYGNQIHVSTNYKLLQRREDGIHRRDFHEMTHVWQWDGNSQAPGGLIEGIADYVRLKAKLARIGSNLGKEYDVIAPFLEYCTSLSNGFIAKLNKKMRSGYTTDFFKDLLGKMVNQLWADYKTKYGHP